jgi:hypothetical protein
METTRYQSTLGEMFGDLSRETRTLVQQQLRLARIELLEKVSQTSRNLVLVVGGALIAYGGVLAIIGGVVLGLIALGLPAWAGALLGGALICGIGSLLVHSGLTALRRQDFRPHQTIASLKEDAQWLKSQTQ